MMNPFKRLFGRGTGPPSAGAFASDPAQDPDKIRVYDGYGRELFITRQQWRDSILPGALQEAWNDPAQLALLVTGSLHDGFFEDMVKPARRLVQIDPEPARAVVLLACALLKTGRVTDSERILQQHIQRHGESALVLINLAKAEAERGDHPRSVATLWRGLQLDPNERNAVGWYQAIHRERSGTQGAEQALRRIAALPQSWRAQLWLAGTALQGGDLAGALRLYRESLIAGGVPPPLDLLVQMSGDLGKAGQLQELLALTVPVFDPGVHGVEVANNLLKACVELERLDAARALLDQMYARQRPDWKETLGFWDNEIAQARVAESPVAPQEKLSAVFLAVNGPLWLPDGSPAHELFRSVVGAARPIGFLGSTTSSGRPGSEVVVQLSDAPGRFSRALPFFLAEQVQLGSNAAVRTLVPWMQGGRTGFVLGGMAWGDADAARYAQMDASPCDYVVVTHLETSSEPWQVALRLVRTADGECVGSADASFLAADPERAVAGLSRTLLRLLAEHAGVVPAPAPPWYRVPAGAAFPFYLLRLEQLLAVRCAGLGGVARPFLSGEREILDGNLHLCLDHPGNVLTRVLLFQTVKALKDYRPEVVAEYQDKLEQLQREHPLAEPAHTVTERLRDAAG
jgi:tetratricopeptide (TPR) repeat protein